MLLIILIVLAWVGIITTVLLHKFVAPPGAGTVIVFDAGRAYVKRGNISAQTLRFVEDVLRQSRIKSASIGILPNATLWFSPSTPVDVHQQLRNILLP